MAVCNVSPYVSPCVEPMRPTKLLRWRSLPLEPGRQFERSVLDQLWVDDLRTRGEWRQVPRVDEDAGMLVDAAHLPDLL